MKFGGFDDPKMTLQEALAGFEKEYGVRFDVNEPAFRFRRCRMPELFYFVLARRAVDFIADVNRVRLDEGHARPFRRRQPG